MVVVDDLGGDEPARRDLRERDRRALRRVDDRPGIERVLVHADDGLAVERGGLADVVEAVDAAGERLDVHETAVALRADVGLGRDLDETSPGLTRERRGLQRRLFPDAVQRLRLRPVRRNTIQNGPSGAGSQFDSVPRRARRVWTCSVRPPSASRSRSGSIGELIRYRFSGFAYIRLDGSS